jgi:hypothetical protein
MVAEIVDEIYDNLTTMVVNDAPVVIRKVVLGGVETEIVFILENVTGIGAAIGNEICLEYPYLSLLPLKLKVTREQKQDNHIQAKQFEQREKIRLSRSRSIRNPRYEP